MLYKLGKKFFKLTYNALHFLQACLILLSIFVIAYWLLQLANAPFIKPVAPFFEGINAYVHLFYNRLVVIGGTTIDFSFFIAAIILLLAAFGIKYAIELIEISEEHFESLNKTYKKHAEKAFNAQLEREYLRQESKNNKTITLLKFNASKLLKGSLYGDDIKGDPGSKAKEVLFDCFEILDEDMDCKKELLDNGILLYFDDYNNIDKFINSLNRILKGIKTKYIEDKWQVSYTAGIDVYADSSEIEQKKEALKKLVKLGLNDKITCLGTFKHRYSLLKKPSYTFSAEGFYTIIENEEVFSIEILR